jgi:hypothetical protein
MPKIGVWEAPPTEPWRIRLRHDHDKLEAALRAANIAATPALIALLDAMIDTLKVQMVEHRERPGIRQRTREADFFFGLWSWYEARLKDARLGHGGKFHKFATACCDLADIREPTEDALNAVIKRALKESRPAQPKQENDHP